jgi:CubicO group peptidase (beta-lactamase class C family)
MHRQPQERREFLKTGFIAAMMSSFGRSLSGAAAGGAPWQQAVDVLEKAVAAGTVRSAVLHVTDLAGGGREAYTRAFGENTFEGSMYLLGSISKPVVVTGLMTLFDRGAFRLEDKISKFIPEFRGEGREEMTLQQVLTHVSGLPDQLARNAELRQAHAPLSEFVRGAVREPLLFRPGQRYEYSSMGILLASRVAELISGEDIRAFTQRTVLGPLGMKRSAQGLGAFALEEVEPMQIEHAAPEAGGGDPASASWNWNSAYWRALGAPWGGTHASAGDVAAWLAEFLLEQGRVVRPETARWMTTNRNAAGITPRGLGFHVGRAAGGAGCSEQTFGHTGSTGTIAWADPGSRRICVVLTALPARAVVPHPRDRASDAVAAVPRAAR